jgi:hypothetical protein
VLWCTPFCSDYSLFRHVCCLFDHILQLYADTQGILSCDARMGYAADPLVLDERGCSDRCTAVDPDTQELMVGRSDGVYFYTGVLFLQWLY